MAQQCEVFARLLMARLILDGMIAEQERAIDTINFIAARCSTDGQARAYEQNRRERAATLVEAQRRRNAIPF